MLVRGTERYCEFDRGVIDSSSYEIEDRGEFGRRELLRGLK